LALFRTSKIYCKGWEENKDKKKGSCEPLFYFFLLAAFLAAFLGAFFFAAFFFAMVFLFLIIIITRSTKKKLHEI
jgi:hypothetical protein